MHGPVRLLAFAGSAREGSFNRRLAALAAAAASRAGAEVTLADVRELPMPLFDQDLEAASGMPENARRFKRLLVDHHAFLIACPEYNGSITPLLKNAIDWASRVEEEGEQPLLAYRGKVAGLLSASPGELGGLRGLVHVRAILSGIGVLVVPTQVALPRAREAFAEDGSLQDARRGAAVERLAREVVELTGKIAE